MSAAYLTKQPCGDCGSSDALAYYRGETLGRHTSHCFSCNITRAYPELEEAPVTQRQGKERSMVEKKTSWEQTVAATSAPEGFRGVTTATLNRYSVRGGDRDDAVLYPYVRGFKKRSREEKEFTFIPSGVKALGGDLFGQQVFPAGGKFLTITEGELDALSLYQAFGAHYPVVSIPNGAAAALKDCQEAFKYISSFDTVVIMFDADEPGQKAAQEVAKLFVGRAKVATLDPALKDANGYLMANKTKELTKAFWDAQPYRPSGVVNFSSLLAEVLSPAVEALFSFMTPELEAKTDGVRPGEIVILAAGTGVGKSAYAREWVDHILRTTAKDVRVGMLMLEESPPITAKRQVAIRMRVPIYRRNVTVSEEALKESFESLAGDGRLEIYSQLKVTSPKEILETAEYMIRGLGCKVLVLDHISIVISGSESDNERKEIDIFMTNLRALTESTGASIIGISHLARQSGSDAHEEGGRVTTGHMRGSGSIAQLVDFIIALERNTQEVTDEQGGSTTLVRVLKNRWLGDVGPASIIRYNPITGVSEYVGPAIQAPSPQEEL